MTAPSELTTRNPLCPGMVSRPACGQREREERVSWRAIERSLGYGAAETELQTESTLSLL